MILDVFHLYCVVREMIPGIPCRPAHGARLDPDAGHEKGAGHLEIPLGQPSTGANRSWKGPEEVDLGSI